LQTKLIVFDLDGTLYVTESSFIPAMRQFLGRYNRPVPSDKFLYSFVGEPDHVFGKWIETLNIEKPADELLREFDEIEAEAVKQKGYLYDSVGEVLEWLKERCFTMVICSNGSGWYIDLILDKFDITRYFALLKTPRSKTETKSVMLSDITATVTSDISYMVGDRKHDISAARQNDYISIGAAYGYGGDEIKNADFVITDIKEIKTILG